MNTDAHAQTIQQNISGFNLPGVTLPQGHDEVRAADGTTCRSAVGGGGAYMDIGVIGNPQQSNDSEGSMSAYGRLVVPLGANRKRVDCSKLYDLEVARLEMELRLMQMGMGRGMAPVSEGFSSSSAETEVGTPIDGSALAKASGQDDDQADNVQVAKLDTVKPADEDPSDDWADDGWSTEGLKKKK